MEPAVQFTVDPTGLLWFVLFAVGGVALGTASGLVPGLHANNFALLLAAFAASIPADPLLIGVAMLTAGVVHTFLDIVPALALGVPDAAMAIAALPGHRLVLAGRGREALRLSAVGSAMAVGIALPLAIPITWLMIHGYPTIRAHLWVVLGAIVCLLVVTESTPQAAAGGLFGFLLAAVLGWAVLDVSPEAPLGSGSMLTPLLTGLFGAPILLDAMGGGGVPPQADAKLTMAHKDLDSPREQDQSRARLWGICPASQRRLPPCSRFPQCRTGMSTAALLSPRVARIRPTRCSHCSRLSRSARHERV